MKRRRGPAAVVFLGPSLPAADARRVFDVPPRPPAALGDVYEAVEDGVRLVVLIDGYFERVPAVWHKELLFALSRGVRVLGGASMGALRAAELDRFGMVGVGRVYEWFRTGELTGDDEVAVSHQPGRGGYRPVSEALVNIRATVAAAVTADVVSADSGRRLVTGAKETFYPDRTYDGVLARAAADGVPAAQVDALREWLPSHAVDQKRDDALAVLRAAAADPASARPRSRPFEQTWIWRDLIALPVREGRRPERGSEAWQ